MRLSFENSFARSGLRGIVFSLFAAAFLFGGQPAIQRALAQAGSIGEVTFQIGQAHVERSGAYSSLSKGQKIHVGDVLKTSEGGHLHIRFIDGALVSVRPASILKVDTYEFNADRPDESTVKFTLTAGTVRAISGRAAESAKDRFRLNTPFVAIGVRGTDFVTRVDSNRVAAIVNQGAIVFTPLGSGCRADAVGPCSGERARLLSAEMSALIEFGATQVAPLLRPLDPMKGRDTIIPAVPEESSATLKRSQGDADTRSITVSQAIPASPSAATPLAWGRWTSMALFGNLEVSPAITASKDRSPLIGTGNFGLFRYEPSPLSFSNETGVYSFRLEKYSANFVTGASQIVMPASVTDSSLSIDFRNKSFGTRLDLESGSSVRSTLLGIGTVDDKGLFLMNAPDARVLGAVGGGARAAAYTFERSVQGQGTFHGVTLWGK